MVMFNPSIDTAIFLSGAFVLGLALGWVLWKLGSDQQSNDAGSESEFWQQRLNQARQERDLFQTRLEALEKGTPPNADALEGA